MIKVETGPPVNTPDRPPEKTAGKVPEPSVKPSPEPRPEISPAREAASHEETREGNETHGGNDSGNRETLQEGMSGESGTAAKGEHEALLAYIKEFIDKNLVYPPMARRRNIEGTVGISFEIETNGELVSVSVNHSSGSSILDNAAISLVNKIRPFENITIKRKLALRVNIEYKLTE
jgi:protein TonB